MGVLHAEFVQAVQNHMNDDAVLRFVLRRAARSRGTKLSGEQLGHCVAAIKQAIESGADSVVIDGGPSMDLDLTAENISQAFAEFETESAELVERCVLNSVREISPNVLESLYKDAPRALAERRRRRRSFERHLQRRWALGLNRLEMLLIIAEEAGATFLRRLNNDDPNDVFADDEEVGESTCEAIVRLHARACRTAAESLCLLNGGYSDGATARWRSLHELAVTAMFLREQCRLNSARTDVRSPGSREVELTTPRSAGMSSIQRSLFI